MVDCGVDCLNVGGQTSWYDKLAARPNRRDRTPKGSRPISWWRSGLEADKDDVYFGARWDAAFLGNLLHPRFFHCSRSMALTSMMCSPRPPLTPAPTQGPPRHCSYGSAHATPRHVSAFPTHFRSPTVLAQLRQSTVKLRCRVQQVFHRGFVWSSVARFLSLATTLSQVQAETRDQRHTACTGRSLKLFCVVRWCKEM